MNTLSQNEPRISMVGAAWRGILASVALILVCVTALCLLGGIQAFIWFHHHWPGFVGSAMIFGTVWGLSLRR